MNKNKMVKLQFQESFAKLAKKTVEMSLVSFTSLLVSLTSSTADVGGNGGRGGGEPLASEFEIAAVQFCSWINRKDFPLKLSRKKCFGWIKEIRKSLNEGPSMLTFPKGPLFNDYNDEKPCLFDQGKRTIQCDRDIWERSTLINKYIVTATEMVGLMRPGRRYDMGPWIRKNWFQLKPAPILEMDARVGENIDIKPLDRCSQDYARALIQLESLAFIKPCESNLDSQNEIRFSKYLFNGNLSRDELTDALNLIQDLGGTRFVVIRPVPQTSHNIATFIVLPVDVVSEIRRLTVSQSQKTKGWHVFRGSIFIQNQMETLDILSN